jgi:hypothetical protein
MALEGLTQEQIDQYENMLMTGVPTIEPVGNVTLCGRLVGNGWTEELYWEIRNRLIERGLLAKGKGKGGSVRRVPLTVAGMASIGVGTAATALSQVDQAYVAYERDLYQPMIEVIKSRWAQDYRLDSLVAEITAAQGSKQTRGKWTRPDITVASFKTFPYVPGRHFDLITFEIKPTATIDVTVIYEALGHRRAATRSYALLHVPESEREALEPVLEEISLEAKRFGVGLVVAASPSDYDTWEEIVEAVRHEPDPERMNDFLAQQVSQGFREQIMKWFK